MSNATVSSLQYQAPFVAGNNTPWKHDIVCTMLVGEEHIDGHQCACIGTTKATLDRGEKCIEEYDLESLVNLCSTAHVDLDDQCGIFYFFVRKCAEVGFHKGLKYLLSHSKGHHGDAQAKCQSGHVPCNALYNGLTCGPDGRKDHYKCMIALKKFHKKHFPDGIVR